MIRDYPFATLLTLDHPEPFVSHVPLQYDAERGPKGTLLGHMARANPHWRHFGAGASIAMRGETLFSAGLLRAIALLLFFLSPATEEHQKL